MREYLTAVEEVVDEEDERDDMLEFRVGEVLCFATKEPPPGSLAMYMAATTKNSSTSEAIGGTINFFFSVLDQDSSTHLAARLMDRKDSFEIETVQQILADLIEEWSGRPTVKPSGSTSSRKRGGQKSTRRTPELASSGSGPTDS